VGLPSLLLRALHFIFLCLPQYDYKVQRVRRAADQLGKHLVELGRGRQVVGKFLDAPPVAKGKMARCFRLPSHPSLQIVQRLTSVSASMRAPCACSSDWKWRMAAAQQLGSWQCETRGARARDIEGVEFTENLTWWMRTRSV